MSALVSEYMHCFRKQHYPELFSEQCIAALSNIERKLGKQKAGQVIFEVPMQGNECNCDYSICVDSSDDGTCEYWLEMDYPDYASIQNDDKDIPSSLFFDASSLGKGQADSDFCDRILSKLTTDDFSKKIKIPLLQTAKKLREKGTALFQIGAMKSRNENNSLRIVTEKIRRTLLIEFLKEMNWQGDIDGLDGFLRGWVPVCKRFMLDFDLTEDGISDKVGIEINVRAGRLSDMDLMLEKAYNDGFLSFDRYCAIKRWIRIWPKPEPLIQNDISHLKFTFLNGNIISAKAYLRQSGEFICEDAPAFYHPLQMNLELSDACPLRCPQCYVNLNKGRQMSLFTAKYWIKDAHDAGITAVSLSGGETAEYPFLTEVIKECKRMNLSSAVSFSGAGLTKDKLRDTIDAGVDEIYISLNGSNEETNSMSRDGFEYAAYALKVLKEIQFSNTGINWVMHHSNADDFPNMIELAESYGAKMLIILGPKTDSSGKLDDFPTADDLNIVAQTVKKYEGEIFIDAEPCFSQLRALIHQGHLKNDNRGLIRGCGAGRDCISVTCEGKLIPCRHLDYPEEWSSIMEYWNNSEFLKKLRDVYDNPSGKCVQCKYAQNCLPCLEFGYRLHDRIAFDMEECPLDLRRF